MKRRTSRILAALLCTAMGISAIGGLSACGSSESPVTSAEKSSIEIVPEIPQRKADVKSVDCPQDVSTTEETQKAVVDTWVLEHIAVDQKVMTYREYASVLLLDQLEDASATAGADAQELSEDDIKAEKELIVEKVSQQGVEISVNSLNSALKKMPEYNIQWGKIKSNEDTIIEVCLPQIKTIYDAYSERARIVTIKKDGTGSVENMGDFSYSVDKNQLSIASKNSENIIPTDLEYDKEADVIHSKGFDDTHGHAVAFILEKKDKHEDIKSAVAGTWNLNYVIDGKVVNSDFTKVNFSDTLETINADDDDTEVKSVTLTLSENGTGTVTFTGKNGNVDTGSFTYKIGEKNNDEVYELELKFGEYKCTFYYDSITHVIMTNDTEEDDVYYVGTFREVIVDSIVDNGSQTTGYTDNNDDGTSSEIWDDYREDDDNGDRDGDGNSEYQYGTVPSRPTYDRDTIDRENDENKRDNGEFWDGNGHIDGDYYVAMDDEDADN